MIDLGHLLACAETFTEFCATFGVSLFDWQVHAFGEATRRADGRFVHSLSRISVPLGMESPSPGLPLGCGVS